MALIVTDNNIEGLRKRFDKEFELNLHKFKHFICKNLTELREHKFANTIYKGRPHEQFNKMADICGISANTIKKIESGKENFTIDSLFRLLQFHGIPPKYIMYPRGIEEYRALERNDEWSSTKIGNNIAHAGWKEVSFYFDENVPVMKKTDGTLRPFEIGQTVIFEGSLFKSFRLTFHANEKGQCAILHNIINNQSFRTVGLKMLGSMDQELTGFPVCSSVLTLCWLDEFTFTMEIRQDNAGVSQYLKSAGIIVS
jgi:transcriptional regulator with XRE-family HTH domain